MKAREVVPSADTSALLAGAQFADAFSIDLATSGIDARRAAENMLTYSPQWMAALMALRNYLVAPFGLKTPESDMTDRASTIGIFPIVSDTPSRLVAGFNDKHLDFRVVVDVAAVGSLEQPELDHQELGQKITLTTLVLTHNWLGRVYLAVILPFHRLIARAKLQHLTGIRTA